MAGILCHRAALKLILTQSNAKRRPQDNAAWGAGLPGPGPGDKVGEGAQRVAARPGTWGGGVCGFLGGAGAFSGTPGTGVDSLVLLVEAGSRLRCAFAGLGVVRVWCALLLFVSSGA